MADLRDQFEQAVAASQNQPERPEDADSPIRKRLRELHRAATEGEPAGREAAMRQYIQVVGDLGGGKG
ncbi:MAG: hypothetical protein ACLGHY_13165 [Gammaproteobacteria bacterium]